MACPAVTSGARFLLETLSHLDCQAQSIGSFGFQSLAAPGSVAASALAALLTLFIALFGIRLLFTSDTRPGDAVTAILKIGIVLTLATSWPAFRTLAYDLVLHAPAEVAASIRPSSLPSADAGFAERLQNIDTGIAALTSSGTGRQAGFLEPDEQTTGGFRAIALQDETAFGWARTVFLGATIGSLAILRIGGGLLLALTPLFAGLLLFEFSRGLFSGWLRGLALIALGSLAVTIILSVEVALLEPWLQDSLGRRTAGYAIPAAPTELLALTLAFAAAISGILFLLGKVAFQNTWSTVASFRASDSGRSAFPSLVPARPSLIHSDIPVHSRSLTVSESVANILRREGEAATDAPRRWTGPSSRTVEEGAGATRTHLVEPLGSSYRRTSRRQVASTHRRDERS